MFDQLSISFILFEFTSDMPFKAQIVAQSLQYQNRIK